MASDEAPLSGLRVLDFTALLPGPYATLTLADLGAEVVRVESAARPDWVRDLPPRVGGRSALFGYLNRGKRSVGLNLRGTGAVDVVRRLLARYDVVVEQWRPGVMERLGLGYESLRAVRPDLIYCSITGYGQSGPLRARAGHDLNYMALSGAAWAVRGRDGRPLAAGLQIADLAGGAQQAVTAILAAVVRRQRTGAGAFLDVSITDGMFALNAVQTVTALAGAGDPPAATGLLDGGTLYDYYPTRDGQHVAVGALEPRFVDGLAEALGDDALHGLRDLTDGAVQQRLKTRLARHLAGLDLGRIKELFAQVQACVEPVLSPARAAAHPQLRARGMVVDVPMADGACTPQPACPIRLGPARVPGPAPDLGADTGRVLAEAGFAAAEVAELLACGTLEGQPC